MRNRQAFDSGRLVLALGISLLPFVASSRVAAEENPRTLDELWSGYAELDRTTPLQTEVLKEWEEEGVVCRIVRYQVGVFKGRPSRVAGFYAFPKGGSKLPALLDLHGGGQSASLDNVVNYARRGYACLSLNWGGNKLNFGRSKQSYDGPQTDWGALDATHPPQRDKVNHFAGSLAPNEFTLDAVESPRNSNWFVVLMAARRGLTFLENQPEVDTTRLGVFGHSMGGKLTTDLAGIDKRVKAAVPSCGGSGDLVDGPTDFPAPTGSKPSPMELACVSDNAYIPRITCPVLWLSPTNDFNARLDNMAWNWRGVPDDRLRFSISPHFNHRHTDECALTQLLWFEEHLKGTFKMPATPEITLDLKASDGIPRVRVAPDDSRPVRSIDVYCSTDPHTLTRFWRDARAVKSGARWEASCPVMDLENTLLVFANVTYETPPELPKGPQVPGQSNITEFTISSRVRWVSAQDLRAAGTKATDKPDRMIDDGSRGWHDWYRLNWGHPPLWTAVTRKLTDPKWRGPDGARLVFEIQSRTDNTLVLTFQCNGWGVYEPGQPALTYTAVKTLKGGADLQTVSVGLDELVAADPKTVGPLSNWRTVTEFSLSPSGEVVKDGRKVKVEGKAWEGPREIRNLRWEGG